MKLVNNTLNMEENQHDKKEEAVEQSKQDIQKDAKGLIDSIRNFLVELLDFRHDTDHEATIEAIKLDIPFKGATAWILIFAVFVASIGLNANATAVVIGAMLISPLMGPILGIGMSIAINDIDTLKKSAINLATMIVLSLLTSFFFFKIFPLSEDNSELLGRVRPDIRDVLIAFFGGLALMVARTKKGTIASVIFGVAIATALMPPLCTAGYGLAIWNKDYFFGAMYLFTINTIFIALATFLVLKLLRFPMHKYANAAKRKRFAWIASTVGILVMIPAILTFIKVFNENNINNSVKAFIKNEIKSNPKLQLMEHDKSIVDKTISLNFFNEVDEAMANALNNQLQINPLYSYIKDFNLKIKGSDTKSFELITTAYKEKREELEEKKAIIKDLKGKITDLETTISNLNQRIEQIAITNNEKNIPFSSIAKEAKIRFKHLEKIEFARVLSSSDFINIDTIPMATFYWDKTINDSIAKIKKEQLRKWLQDEVQLDTLVVK